MFEQDILKFDNQIRHYDIEFEAACFAQSLNLRQINNKIILENANPEDATELYLAESKESGKKKKNIFIRLIDKIKEFITKILNKLTGNKFQPKRKITVPGNPEELMKQGRELLQKAKKQLSKIPGSTSAQIVGSGVAAGVATGIAINASDYVMELKDQGVTLKRIRQFMKESNETLNSYKDILKSEESLEGEKIAAKAYISEFGKITSRLGKIVNAIMTKSALSSDSQYEKDAKKYQDFGAINGMSRQEILDEREKIQEEIDRIKKSSSFSNEVRRSVNGFMDKTGEIKARNQAIRDEGNERLRVLYKRRDRCDTLLRERTKRIVRDGSRDLNRINDDSRRYDTKLTHYAAMSRESGGKKSKSVTESKSVMDDGF